MRVILPRNPDAVSARHFASLARTALGLESDSALMTPNGPVQRVRWIAAATGALLADDNPTSTDIVKAMLDLPHLNVDSVTTGHEVLSHLESRP